AVGVFWRQTHREEEGEERMTATTTQPIARGPGVTADDRRVLVAHLLRRAGFGTTPEELDAYATRPYEEVVDDLVHPERFPDLEEDVLSRYYPHMAANRDNPGVWNGRWFYRMLNTRRPL